METFPLIFGRVGGYPIEALNSFKSEIGDTFLNKFLELNHEIEMQRHVLIDKLYLEISNEHDEQRRNAMLNFKRDLFNKRQRAENTFQILICSEDIKSEAKRYFQKRDEVENLVKEFNAIFCSEELLNVESLNDLISLFFFRNGLIFSSHVLHHELRKQPLKTESPIISSLLKYLTRSLAKTTPFSSFNSIFFLHKKFDIFTSTANIKSSNIQISNLFYYYLKSALLKETSFRDLLIVRSNSTIWVENGSINTLHFFQNDRNNESFKKFKSSSTLLEIKNLLENNNLMYRKLILELQLQSDETQSSVEDFVGILIKEGFLKIIFPVPWTNKNWISELLDYLRKNRIDTEFRMLDSLLKSIDETIGSLENCFEVDARYKMILDCHSEILNFFKSTDPSNEFLRKVGAQELFYEDHLINIQQDIPEAIVKELLSEVNEAFSVLNNIPVNRLKRINIAKSSGFDGNEKLPILSFYEKFYLPRHQDSAFLKQELRRVEKIISVIIERIEKTPEQNSIDISNITKQEKKSDLKSSFGVYIQTEDDEFKSVVLNSFGPGYGASISRFLNSLPEMYSKELIAYNEGLLTNKTIIEIKDASIHNVGNFPKVTDSLIDLCDDRNVDGFHNLISLSDVYVIVNEFKDLILVDSNGKKLQILNFSLEGLNRRSAFYKFIDMFNDAEACGLNYLLIGIRQFFESKVLQEGVVSIPRIKFKERLILQRRKWLILRIVLKDVVSNSKERGENFLNLNSFMIKNGIPAEVFVNFAKRDLKNLRDDNYKPQYFNFRIPVFTGLFINQLNKAGDVIEISEMFPTPDGVRKSGGRVKEYIFNCN